MTLFLAILALVFAGVFVTQFGKTRASEPAACHVCGKNQVEPVYIKGFAFCSRHAELYQNGVWISFLKGSSSPDDPEFGVKMHLLKERFSEQDVASFIQTRYEAVEGEIVTRMELMVLEEDLERAKALSKPKLN